MILPDLLDKTTSKDPGSLFLPIFITLKKRELSLILGRIDFISINSALEEDRVKVSGKGWSVVKFDQVCQKIVKRFVSHA